MLHETVDLYDYFKLSRKEGCAGYLDVYAQLNFSETPKNRKRPAVLVNAGGGYGFVSDREKEPIAVRFLAEGFNCFALRYSIAPAARFPVQLTEAAMAMAYIRENAEKLCVSPSHVAAVGFSAGGHLTAQLGVDYACEEIAGFLKERGVSARPDAVILSYPVISSKLDITHLQTFTNLCEGKRELMERLSLEDRVTADSSPAFIWHTVNDEIVPWENSAVLAAVYAKAGAPFELHVFESGPHGLSLADRETWSGNPGYDNADAACWFKLALNFLKRRGFAIAD